MSFKSYRNGFTLVEILVALALIAAILSMMCGSYFATSRSAQVCRAGITLRQQGWTALDQMAQQIRCAYAGTIAHGADSGESLVRPAKMEQRDISYFNANSDALNGEILRFVTTDGYVEKKEKPAPGLFEITYRFDRRTGVLSLNQEPFTGTPVKAEEKDFKPIAENIERLELEFFDGGQWLCHWDFKDKKRLPYAVKVHMDCQNEDNQRCDYRTIASIPCRKDRVETDIASSVSARK